MGKIEIINKLISEKGYMSYLEIGVGKKRVCFKQIVCFQKASVDPDAKATFKMTSDAFFEANKEKFDIIFIDGLHL